MSDLENPTPSISKGAILNLRDYPRINVAGSDTMVE